MLIPHWITAHGAMLYELFYALPFYLVTAGILIVGLRRGFPLIPFVLILAVGRMGFLVGTWAGGNGGRSTLFSVVFALAFLLPTIHYLRFRHPILDLYALFLPLGLALQRLGCLSVGCCFGLPTDSIFGIQYELPGTAGLTPFLHPVPLYFLFGYLAVFAVLFVMQRRIAFAGGLAFLGLALLSLSRFVVEFFRDPYSNQMLADAWMGLKGVQWVSLGLMVAFMVVYAYLAVRSRKSISEQMPQPLGASELRSRERLVGMALVISFVASFGLMSQAEWVALLPSMILLLGAVLWELGKLNLPTILVGILVTIFGATAAAPDSTVWKGFVVSGVTQGRYDYPTQEEDDGCGNTYYTKYDHRNYLNATMGARLSGENLTGIRKYMELEALGYDGSFYSSSNDWNWNMRGGIVQGNFNVGWFGAGIGVLRGTTPPGSLVQLHRTFGHFQIGNYRNGYVVAGVRDDFASTGYFGIGGRLLNNDLNYGVGITGGGGYGDLSYTFAEQGLSLEFRGVAGGTKERVDEASLRLVMELP